MCQGVLHSACGEQEESGILRRAEGPRLPVAGLLAAVLVRVHARRPERFQHGLKVREAQRPCVRRRGRAIGKAVLEHAVCSIAAAAGTLVAVHKVLRASIPLLLPAPINSPVCTRSLCSLVMRKDESLAIYIIVKSSALHLWRIMTECRPTGCCIQTWQVLIRGAQPERGLAELVEGHGGGLRAQLVQVAPAKVLRARRQRRQLPCGPRILRMQMNGSLSEHAHTGLRASLPIDAPVHTLSKSQGTEGCGEAKARGRMRAVQVTPSAIQ